MLPYRMLCLCHTPYSVTQPGNAVSSGVKSHLLAVCSALGLDSHVGGAIGGIRSLAGGGRGITPSQEQGIVADGGVGHSCGLPQVLLAGAVLLEVYDATASHTAHLQASSATWAMPMAPKTADGSSFRRM